MKKILSLLGTITLIGTSTTSLVACNKPQEKEYTPEELAKLKEENKINTTNQEIKDNLEWIAPQEKPLPFVEVDNKYYFVVWRGNENFDYKIVKFKYLEKKEQILDNFQDKHNKYELIITQFGGNLFIYKNGNLIYNWRNDYNAIYFKSVYRWNLDTTEPNLVIDDKGNIKVNK